MLSGSASTLDLKRELRGEFFVLRVLVFCSIIYLFLQVGSMFRLFGVPGIPPLLLLGYRILDIIVVGSFFLVCGARLKVRWVDLPLLLMIPYPFLIGISRGYINLTFFHDIATVTLFLLKVLVIRTLVIRFMKKTDFDEAFRKYAQKIIKRSILVAILMLMIANAALATGAVFYYQAPAELTFAAAFALAQGHAPTYFIILALATIGGKRGIMVGILAIGVLGSLTRQNIGKSFASFLILGILVAVALVTLSGSNPLSDAAFMRRLISTWDTLVSAAKESMSFEEFLTLVDSGRFVEYVSLKPYMEGWAFWFGNGYGFRYTLDIGFLNEVGRSAVEDTVSNAHFTPLAIMAKFGMVGLFLWMTQVAAIFLTRRDPRSYFQTASWLGVISMLVQSTFSFLYFISFFMPIFVAGATLRYPRGAESRIAGVNGPYLKEVR